MGMPCHLLFDFATGGTALGMGKKRKTKQNKTAVCRFTATTAGWPF
jgi:hypothetical protein